jgi:GNAT superfamily N-acetyltransferase
MSSITIRAAKGADEPAVLAMAKAEMAVHEQLDARFRLRADAMTRYAIYLRDRMKEIDSAVFVAEETGMVIGVAIGSIRVQDAFFETRRYGYVSDLMVAPDRRRRGVGRALWERVALWFKSLGIDIVRLHVAANRAEARSFWRSIGAEDFLAEAWIDLPAATSIVAGRAPAEGAQADSGSAVLRGDRLAGDSGVI